MFLALFIAFLIASIVPASLYFGRGGGRGRAWGMVAAGEDRLGRGAYRDTHVVRWKRGEAPLVVRVAALSSFYMGQMALPGALIGLLGLVGLSEDNRPAAVWWVLELSVPTGLAVAIFLLSAGWSMLDSGEKAVVRARLAARWAIVHNLALFAAVGFAVAVDAREVEVTLVPCVYGCISIAQALLVRRAADAIEAYDAARAQDPAPIDAEVALWTEDLAGKG